SRLADGSAHGLGQHFAGALRGTAGLSIAGGTAQADIWLYAFGDHGLAAAEPPMTTVLPPFMRMGFQAFARDWRAGELRMLLLAVMIAVAAITSVGFLADRAAQVLERDAAQMLGGDIVLRSAKPLPGSFEEEAQRRGLTVGHT